MPRYEYECKAHGRVEVTKPAELAGREEYCARCLRPGPTGHYRPMRRIFSTQPAIIRPGGYNRRPGDPGFDDFSYELECGELKDDATSVHADAEKHDREVAERWERERFRLPDNWLDPDTEQELHEIARAADLDGEWEDVSLVPPAVRRQLEGAGLTAGIGEGDTTA